MLAYGGEDLLHQIDHTLVCVHRVFLVGDRSLVPCGVVRAERVFAELTGTFELVRPFVEMTANLACGCFGKTHMGTRMRGIGGDRGQILNSLVCGDAPLLVDAVQIAQIARQPGAHADQFVGELVEMLAGHARLEPDRGDKLTVDAGVGILIGDIQYHAGHLIGMHGLEEMALLLRHAGHIQHGTSVHHAS